MIQSVWGIGREQLSGDNDNVKNVRIESHQWNKHCRIPTRVIREAEPGGDIIVVNIFKKERKGVNVCWSKKAQDMYPDLY